MPKLVGIRVRGDRVERSRILLPPHLADLFRQTCRHLEKSQEEAFEEMLELLVERYKESLEPIYEGSVK